MEKSTKDAWTGNNKNLSPEAKEKRKSINKKILKFGCLPIIGIFVIITLIGLFSTDENSTETNDTTNSTEIKEELPNPISSKVNLGILKMDENGYTLGKKTELTELKRLVNIDSIDVIEIDYELQGSYGKILVRKSFMIKEKDI